MRPPCRPPSVAWTPLASVWSGSCPRTWPCRCREFFVGVLFGFRVEFPTCTRVLALQGLVNRSGGFWAPLPKQEGVKPASATRRAFIHGHGLGLHSAAKLLMDRQYDVAASVSGGTSAGRKSMLCSFAAFIKEAVTDPSTTVVLYFSVPREYHRGSVRLLFHDGKSSGTAPSAMQGLGVVVVMVPFCFVCPCAGSSFRRRGCRHVCLHGRDTVHQGHHLRNAGRGRTGRTGRAGRTGRRGTEADAALHVCPGSTRVRRCCVVVASLLHRQLPNTRETLLWTCWWPGPT